MGSDYLTALILSEWQAAKTWPKNLPRKQLQELHKNLMSERDKKHFFIVGCICLESSKQFSQSTFCCSLVPRLGTRLLLLLLGANNFLAAVLCSSTEKSWEWLAKLVLLGDKDYMYVRSFYYMTLATRPLVI